MLELEGVLDSVGHPDDMTVGRWLVNQKASQEGVHTEAFSVKPTGWLAACYG